MANEKDQTPGDTKPGAARGQDHTLPSMERRNGKQRYGHAHRITGRTETQPGDPSVVHQVIAGAVRDQKACREQQHCQQNPGAWPEDVDQRDDSACGNSEQGEPRTPAHAPDVQRIARNVIETEMSTTYMVDGLKPTHAEHGGPFAVSENPVVPERLSGIAAPPANRRGAGRIFDRVIAVAITAGLLPCATLLLSMGYDFGREYSVLCILPTLFFACVIRLIARNVLFAFRGRLPQSPLSRWRRLLLASAIPAGLLASALGCMGLSLTGCSRTCGINSAGVDKAAI